jgi:pimeloyl-ACP methyl ester carboxylesterase
MKATQHRPQRFSCHGCLRWLARGLSGIALLLLALACMGYVYEHYAAARDRERYPPPGQWVAIDGHKLHLYCTGVGMPTVILEAQANSSSLDWGYVQPEVAKFTRVCSYDRAGFGWSDLGTPPRTAQREADELHQLLRAAGETGAHILVGASYGGHIVRLYAHTYPQEVAGVVLVDARPEKFFTIPAIRQQANGTLGFLKVISVLGEFGLSRPFMAWMPEKMIPAAAAPLYNVRPGSYAIVFQSKLWHASYGEASAIDASDAEVAAAGSMGDLPLVVIRHGKTMFGSLPPAEANAMEQKWQAFQGEMAEQSTQSQLMVAEASGHGVQLEQPLIIVDAIRQLVTRP